MLGKLAEEIHKNSVEKGFWKDHMDIDSIVVNHMDESGTAEYLRSVVDKAFIAQKVMLIVSELAEAIEALRDDKFVMPYMFDLVREKEFDSELFERTIKNSFEDELADVIIRLLDLSSHMKINIDEQIRLKMLYNKTRPHLHGRKF